MRTVTEGRSSRTSPRRSRPCRCPVVRDAILRGEAAAVAGASSVAASRPRQAPGGPREGDERRRLALARLAPGGPEVHHHRPPAVRGEGHPLTAVEGGQRDGGRARSRLPGGTRVRASFSRGPRPPHPAAQRHGDEDGRDDRQESEAHRPRGYQRRRAPPGSRGGRVASRAMRRLARLDRRLGTATRRAAAAVPLGGLGAARVAAAAMSPAFRLVVAGLVAVAGPARRSACGRWPRRSAAAMAARGCATGSAGAGRARPRRGRLPQPPRRGGHGHRGDRRRRAPRRSAGRSRAPRPWARRPASRPQSTSPPTSSRERPSASGSAIVVRFSGRVPAPGLCTLDLRVS